MRGFFRCARIGPANSETMLPRQRSDMALTQAMLKAMGIEDEKRDQIMEAHQGVLESIKTERDELKELAAKVPNLEKAIEEFKAAQPTEDWEKKYNDLKEEFDGFKTQVETEKAEGEKARLYKAMLREAGIDEKRIEPIMKVTDLGGISVVDGAIADQEAVKAAIAEEWGGFIPQTTVQGASVEEPPSNVGGKMTRDEIMAIKDTSARQKAIAANIEQFR